jgi:hypothetical protein
LEISNIIKDLDEINNVINWNIQGKLWEKEKEIENILINWDKDFLEKIKKEFLELKELFDQNEKERNKEMVKEIVEKKEGSECWVEIEKIKYSQYKINLMCREDIYGKRRNIMIR